jgi:hypothetical protein
VKPKRNLQSGEALVANDDSNLTARQGSTH